MKIQTGKHFCHTRSIFSKIKAQLKWAQLNCTSSVDLNQASFLPDFSWKFPLAHDSKKRFLLFDIRWYISPVYYESFSKLTYRQSAIKPQSSKVSDFAGLSFRRVELKVDGPEFCLLDLSDMKFGFRIFEQNILWNFSSMSHFIIIDLTK